MCIVCDVNTLPSIFSHDENDYSPVRDWIIRGKGKVVYGGTSYLKELSKMTKYNRILKLLGDQNKIVVVDQSAVDRKEIEVKSKVNNKCNDPHLIAILVESGCKLVCSND